MKEKNKSIIEWRTGTPNEEGEYIVTLFNGEITFNEYCCITNSDGKEDFFWSNWDEDSIIAWCKLDDIEPYKEETMEEKLMPKIDFNDYCKDKYLLDLGNYEIKEENGKTYVVRKQPQYPKT